MLAAGIFLPRRLLGLFRANTQLAESADVHVDNGIVLDELGQTSIPGIWAAGDCTVFLFGGHPTRLESVQHAVDQAHGVALNMLGAEVPYEPLPWFCSDQYNIKLQIAGLNRGYTDVVVRNGSKPGTASHWYFRDDKLISVDAMNAPREFLVAKQLIAQGKSPTRAQAADPEFALKGL